VLYFVSKTLTQPRRVRYRGFVYALLVDKSQQPAELTPEEAVQNDVVPTNALDRIKWSVPRVEHEDLTLDGKEFRGGRTTLEGQLYWRGKFVEPKIKIVFSWAYAVDPQTGRPKLVYTKLEEDSSHALVDEKGNAAEFDALTLNYLRNAVGKDITVLPEPKKQRLQASVPPQTIRFRGATYRRVA
jgi:hypothetical protein